MLSKIKRNLPKYFHCVHILFGKAIHTYIWELTGCSCSTHVCVWCWIQVMCGIFSYLARAYKNGVVRMWANINMMRKSHISIVRAIQFSAGWLRLVVVDFVCKHCAYVALRRNVRCFNIIKFSTFVFHDLYLLFLDDASQTEVWIYNTREICTVYTRHILFRLNDCIVNKKSCCLMGKWEKVMCFSIYL